MPSLSTWKIAYVSAFFAASSSAQSISASKTLPTPNVTIVQETSISRPTRNWISPEYKWFFEYPLPIPPQKSSKLTYTNKITQETIDYYEIELKPFMQQIYPNLPPTNLVGYDGISPGPQFTMQKGREAVVRFLNNGGSDMSVHVHGQYNRAPFDGWAADYAQPGQYKDYYYPNAQNARTIWYHDHTEYTTAEHAYRGQEGLYIITDAEEQSLGLPSGKYDIPLTLGAKTYGSNGQLIFDTLNNVGLWGDIIHVNGQPWPYLNVEPRKYRLRVLNGAISRSFSLSFVEGLNGTNIPFDVVASDGGLFSHPVNTNSISLSMGERYEIIFDFSGHAEKNITLRNAQGIGENVDYAATDLVMQFKVDSSVSDNSNNGPFPSTLHYIPPAPQTDVVKDFTFGRSDDGEWLINGVGFSDIENRILTRPPRGDDEIWTLHNGNGGGTHPVHIHLVDFQVLSRTSGRNTVLPYESAGMKDVVWLAGGETVQVVARYAPWDGIYMFHCHNLVHEDHDMLVAFNITQLEKWGYTNDTKFIDPMEPEFRPKNYDSADYTTEAILKKLDWFYSTDAYNQGNPAGISSALDASSTSGARALTISSDIARPSLISTNSAASGSPSSTAIGVALVYSSSSSQGLVASLSHNALSTTSTPKFSSLSSRSLTFSTRTMR